MIVPQQEDARIAGTARKYNKPEEQIMTVPDNPIYYLEA
jgi:hypothetical protein